MSQLELFKRAGNDAINVNPASGVDIRMTESGSDWLWAVFSMFGLCSLIYAGLFVVYEHRGVNLHRYAVAGPLSVSLVMAFSYFTMASNLGWTAVQAEFNHQTTSDQILVPGIRQIFYAKYIAWFLTWPILLYLSELTGVVTKSIDTMAESWSFFELAHSLVLQICGSWFFIIGLLVGSLISSSYKWGYWTMATFAQMLVTFLVFKHQLRDLTTSGVKLVVLIFTHFCIYLYLIAWALTDGGNVITVDAGHVFFGILDLLIFILVPALLVATSISLGATPDFALGRRHHHHDLEKDANVEPVRHSGETEVPLHNNTAHVAVADTEPNVTATQEPIVA
ncbi:LANO_0G17590g1_1 [Lachancea nothofagi CBS 11611]|uniref:LANO_0G17590g1_1 n=1 Tax=Lachancea nothofagi CBS 11611 TaxID=1266666 RepID=A0A1G4KKQ8_9SACH|nr:LANO_0G17590g1_1 [Lachancea nothofagi CBS 11611]